MYKKMTVVKVGLPRVGRWVTLLIFSIKGGPVEYSSYLPQCVRSYVALMVFFVSLKISIIFEVDNQSLSSLLSLILAPFALSVRELSLEKASP